MLNRQRHAAQPAQGVFALVRPERAGMIYLCGALLLSALALGLRYHGLLVGFAADDYAQLGMLHGDYLVPRAAWNLFTFSDGTVAETKALMHGGFYPWWAFPQVRLSMLRPLSSLLLWADFRLFGDDALPYHVHSLLWWLLMIGVVARLFYRLLSLEVALLAFAFFVLDEALGLPIAWIANRNAVVSTVFVVIALLAYLRYREQGAGRDLAIVIGAMTVALAAGEYALCALGYFAAYELLVARGPLARRVRALWPVALPALAYMILRAALGHGPQYSAVYLDPLVDPRAFAAEFVRRMPALFADLVLEVRADYYTFGLPWTYELVRDGRVPEDWLWSADPWRRVHVAIGAGALLVFAALVWARPRDEQSRNVRWLWVGAVAAILPVSGSFPSSRLLLVALLGFAPLLASWVCAAFTNLRTRFAAARVRTALLASAAGLCAAFHLVLPAWQTHFEVLATRMNAGAVRRTVLDMQLDDRDLSQKRMVVVSALEGGSSLYIALTRAAHGKTVPKSCWTLSLTAADHLFTRDTQRSFILSPMGGYTLVSGAPEHMLRPSNAHFRPGQSVDMGGMRVKILALLRGYPKAIRVTFDVPLEDPSLLLVQPTPNGLRAFDIPQLGQSVIIPLPGLLP